MEGKTKMWVLIGFFAVAAILAFAIVKGIGSSQQTTVTQTTTGGSSTVSTGLANLVDKAKGILSGLKLSLT